MKRSGLFALASGCALACGAATDGFNEVGTWWVNTIDFATDTQYWEEHRLPSDGGVAHYLGANLNNQIFAAPVTLRGLDFGKVQSNSSRPQIQGGELTLSGDAFISGSGRGSGSAWGRIGSVDSTVSGTGSNTMTKKGRGELLVNTPFANFGTIAAGGGRLTTTAVSGRLFATDAALAWKGGVFRWAPALAAGGTAEAYAGETSYGPFGGELMWGRGAGDAATLTLASLTRTGNGATLWIAPDGGSSALVNSERLFVTEPPATVNGLLDPGLVTRDPTVASWPFSFLTYDESKGVVPYPTALMKPLAEAGETDVARVTETNDLASSKRVAALVVDNTSRLRIGSGATLSVGDGNAAHPAGVIFNRQRAIGAGLEFDGAGTLDFGASPGVIWNASKNGSAYVNVRTRITGSGGVTFASRGSETATTYPASSAGGYNLYAGVGGWSGPTYINGTVVYAHALDALPGGDIYVLNSSGLEGGELLLDGTYAWSFSQHLHLAGRTNGSQDEAVLRTPTGKTTFNGPVTLEDDAAISSYDPPKGTYDFRGGLYGPGALILSGGATCNLYVPSTIAGIYGENNVTFNVSTNGTLGTGLVWLRGGTAHRFSFTGQDGLVLDNTFRCSSGTLDLDFSYAKVAFNRPATFTSAYLSTFSQLTLGADVTFGRVNSACSTDATAGSDRIVAGADGVTLGIGDDGADSTFALSLADGNGTLSLAKRGSCTVELAPATRTYTGVTSVEAGTLRLNDDPLLSRSLLYWLDADREEYFTKDVSGNVSAWRSRGGSADVTFTATGTPSWGANKVNGRNVVTTDASAASKLAADKPVTQNTVFIVYRIHELRENYMEIFGKSGNDYGVRLADAKPDKQWTGWNKHRADYNYITTTSYRRDGQPNGVAGLEETHILTMVHDRDNWPHSSTWGGNTGSATFVPSIGYYSVSGRCFSGDYCEVLAFDRVLTETEMRKVENYLSEKWLAKTIWDDVGTSTFLPPDTALSVGTGAMLDLAGHSLTVGSLAGNGTVTNSSAIPATLTVTGGGNFTGKVGGRTTLAVNASASMGAVVSEGATLAVNGGTVTAGEHVLTPSVDGLAYWCDAARTNTILRDGSGNVTSWVSRAESSASALVNTTGKLPDSGNPCARPTYSATAMGGKPGVYYEQNCRALWADAKSPVRTVFIAVRLDGKQMANAGLWGIGGKTLGYRSKSSGQSTSLASWSDCCVRPGSADDRVAMDGVNYGSDELALGDGIVRVFSARLGGDAETAEAHFSNIGLGSTPTRTTCVGSFDGNSSLKGAIGEVIAYNRELSDSEMSQVEAYLMSKWQNAVWAEGDMPAEREDALTDGALTVAAGAEVRLAGPTALGRLSSGGGAIVGDLTLGGVDVAVKPDGTVDAINVSGSVTLAQGASLHVAAENKLKSNQSWPFLTATVLRGTFASDDLPDDMWYSLTDTAASLTRSRGTLLIVK